MVGPDIFIYLNLFEHIWGEGVDLKQAFVRHVTHLSLCLYLLTIGPNLLRSVQSKLSKSFWGMFSPGKGSKKVKKE